MDTLFSKEAIAAQLESDLNLLFAPTGWFLRESILADPLRITNPVMQRLQGFQPGEQFRRFQDYLFTDNHEALMLIDCAMPASETARNTVFIDSLNRFIADVELAMDGRVSFRHFGASEIAAGNASQIKKDTLLSSLFALLLIFALLIYSFRNARKILLVFLSTLFGGLFAIALLYLIRGEVSVIAVGISSIMFGIAINYPLHFIDHYTHTPHPRLVIKDIIEPLTIGNITTVGAFLSLVFIGSNAMCDLGWFAALLLIGTIVFVLLFLPHLLPAGKAVDAKQSLFARITGAPFEKNRCVVVAVLLLSVFFSFFSGGSRFETNMQKINYMTGEQQQEYQRMMTLLNQSRHTLYYVTEGEELEQTLEHNEALLPVLDQLQADGKISGAGYISHFYPSRARQAERAERWNRFWMPRRDSVLMLLNDAARLQGFTPDAFLSFKEMIYRNWQPADREHFDVIRTSIAKNYVIQTDGKSMIINLLYTDADRAQLLEDELNRLRDDAIAFDAGSITRRMIASLSDNFNYVLYVCAFIVFLFLFFSMGRTELALIAFAPLALSWIWILGMMNLFDIRFNIVNIILATFIFGQGDDYTIFITEGLMHEYTYRRKILASYKNSIALSALIMFIGMGMLIFARHPALRSLAEVTIVGMISVVIISFVLPPLMFHALTMHKGCPRIMPVTLRNLAATVYAFLVFLLVSAGITVYGRILFLFRSTEKKKQAFHRIIHRVARWITFHIPQVRTTYHNLSRETFDVPSVIICNHQSHLDLMCILMLTPKLIILTNDWVWRSPFYGRMIRDAEFYPVSQGIDNALDRLEDAVRRGYSIVVFPEGTRSADCSIQRFHRGAFFLAERLKVDITPVLIHGAGHVLPKKELMLRKGEIHIRTLPRITTDDIRFSPDYASRSKQVRHYYEKQYRNFAAAIETPDYYHDRVVHDYLYKGPAIERAVRKSLRRHDNFEDLINQLPSEGRVVVENSGYGEFTLLLALVKKELQVVGLEQDPDKRDVAAHCASVPANLRYLSADAPSADAPADVRILIEKNKYTLSFQDAMLQQLNDSVSIHNS
jgi:1-acyl-sn-glycerol-3-phosphate acyltransferase